MPEGVESSDLVRDISTPAGASRIDWPCTGTSRGDHPLRDIHIEAASPWRLWAMRAAHPCACTLRVYPNLRDRATAALFLKTADPGFRLRRQVGKGREFDNLRHYLPGDSFEDIHWKATARRAFPVVKLYRVEHAQEVYAVIDSSRLSARRRNSRQLRGCRAASRPGGRAAGRPLRAGHVQRPDAPLRARAQRHGSLPPVPRNHLQPARRARQPRFQRSLHQPAAQPAAPLRCWSSSRRSTMRCWPRRSSAKSRWWRAATWCWSTSPRPPPCVRCSPASRRPIWIRYMAAWPARCSGTACASCRSRSSNRGVKLSLVTADRIKAQVTAAYLDVKRRQAL